MWRLILLVATAGAFVLSATISAPVPVSDYVFVQDTERTVYIVRGNSYLAGKLDAKGNFLQLGEYRFDNREVSIPFDRILNQTTVASKEVFEFRSGRLIRGHLMQNGKFLPAKGSAAISFLAYNYDPRGTPIWNLPGYFKLREKNQDPQTTAHASPKN
jgi:hypothetical protein